MRLATRGMESDIARSLRSLVEAKWPDGAGYDPYDALNSPVVRLVSAPDRRLRIAWTQLLRHVPLDLRPLLGIRPHRNPKTIALLAIAYTRLATVGGEGAMDAGRRARACLDWLRDNQSVGFAGAAWGYSFPWQSSRLWLDRGQPSAVCTAFVAQAFLNAHVAWGEPEHLELAASAATFLMRDCPRYETEAGTGISYLPGARLMVHNANILTAAILAQVWRASGGSDPELRELAERAARYTLAEQRADGSWTYDGPPRVASSLIDGFHTGFVLEGLDRIQRALDLDFGEAIARGLAFYRHNLIRPDGEPVREYGRVRPVDIRDCAMALITLDRFTDSPGAVEQRARVLDWTRREMRDDRGHFYFQSGTLIGIRNRIAYPRWQAWMLLALA